MTIQEHAEFIGQGQLYLAASTSCEGHPVLVSSMAHWSRHGHLHPCHLPVYPTTCCRRRRWPSAVAVFNQARPALDTMPVLMLPPPDAIH